MEWFAGMFADMPGTGTGCPVRQRENAVPGSRAGMKTIARDFGAASLFRKLYKPPGGIERRNKIWYIGIVQKESCKTFLL